MRLQARHDIFLGLYPPVRCGRHFCGRADVRLRRGRAAVFLPVAASRQVARQIFGAPSAARADRRDESRIAVPKREGALSMTDCYTVREQSLKAIVSHKLECAQQKVTEELVCAQKQDKGKYVCSEE